MGWHHANGCRLEIDHDEESKRARACAAVDHQARRRECALLCALLRSLLLMADLRAVYRGVGGCARGGVCARGERERARDIYVARWMREVLKMELESPIFLDEGIGSDAGIPLLRSNSPTLVSNSK